MSGFTIVELLVTIGIFAVMVSVVLANYRVFNTNSDFANSVENVVLSLREAQVYGVGAKTTGATLCGASASSFECAYGVHFSISGQYDFFVDTNGNGIIDGGESTETISLGNGTTVTGLQCTTPGGTSACANGAVNITFRRPIPDAFIAESAFQSGSDNEVEITVSNGAKIGKVAISSTGQMSIQ